MQTSQVFAVDRVYGDLQPQFVATDVLKALSQLDVAVGDVFERLLLKVSQEKSRVASIDRRICVSRAKVNAITERSTSNKPTTVFSTSKYPAPQEFPITKTLFHDKPHVDAPSIIPDADSDAHFLPAESLQPAQRDQHMAEVMELFEKVNAYQKTQQPEADMKQEGLGRMPEYVPSVDSVLLFNSAKNPYQKYASWDNLLGSDYEEEEKKHKELAKAPRTIEYGDELPTVHGLSYEFFPKPKEMPDVSAKLPTNLPLTNIADYKYDQQGDANKSIAPSMFHGKALPDLPTTVSFVEGPVAREPSEQNVRVGSMDGELPAPSEPIVDFPNDASPPPLPPSMGDTDQDSPPSPPPVDEEIPPPPPSPMDKEIPPPPPSPVDKEIPSSPPPPQEVRFPALKKTPTAEAKAVESPMNTSLRKSQQHHASKPQTVVPNAKPADKPDVNVSKSLTNAEEFHERMARRALIIGGEQDKMEQRRERAKATKLVVVFKAKEVTAPTQSISPQVPSGNGDTRSLLPTAALPNDDSMNDNHDHDSGDKSNDDDDGFITRIRRMKEKWEVESGDTKPSQPNALPSREPQEVKNSVVNFESQMIGLHRDSDGSLSLSSDSDSNWSDE